MKDFYSQRLQEISNKRKENINKNVLPLVKPNRVNTGASESEDDVLTLAGAPKKPTQSSNNNNPIPEGRFKGAFDIYNEDPSFKAGMDEFLGAVSTMREETKDLGLPEEIIEKRIQALIDQYSNQAKSLGQQQMQGSMPVGMPDQALRMDNIPQQDEFPTEETVPEEYGVNERFPSGGLA